jgi:HK97 family phage prohead protease
MTTTLTRDTVRAAGTSRVLEHRTRSLASGTGMLVRADEGEARKFTGHAAVFNSRTTIGDPFRWGWYEEIASTAFDKTLTEGDARFLIDHNSSLLIARVSAGDLRLSTDGVGLAVDADLDDELSYVKDFVRNLDKRRITGMSFGFYVVRDTWKSETIELEVKGETIEVEIDVRVIEEVRLLEVSAVTFPAYEDTDAGLRATEAAEIRAARGVPTRTQTSPAPAGDQPDEQDATRGNAPAPALAAAAEQNPAPADATRGFEWQHADARAAALKARYRL